MLNTKAKTRKEIKPRKIVFWINTLSLKHAKELGTIDNGNEYCGYDVEVVKEFKTPKECFDFMYWHSDGSVYSLYYFGKLFQSEETKQIFNY